MLTPAKRLKFESLRARHLPLVFPADATTIFTTWTQFQMLFGEKLSFDIFDTGSLSILLFTADNPHVLARVNVDQGVFECDGDFSTTTR